MSRRPIAIPCDCGGEPDCWLCEGSGTVSVWGAEALAQARHGAVPWDFGLADDGAVMVMRDTPRSRNWYKITAEGCTCAGWLHRQTCAHVSMVRARFGTVENLRLCLEDEAAKTSRQRED